MKSLLAFIFAVVLVGVGLYWYYISGPYSKGIQRTLFGKQESMTISSDAFLNGQPIPIKYTCEGQNVNPPFVFSVIPVETKSLAIIVEDPDSVPENFTHWVIFNIRPTVNGVEENSTPDDTVQGVNDFGTTYYGGPCPPADTHTYVFKLFALDKLINLNKGATKQQVLKEMENHVLDEAQLKGTYKKINP